MNAGRVVFDLGGRSVTAGTTTAEGEGAPRWWRG